MNKFFWCFRLAIILRCHGWEKLFVNAFATSLDESWQQYRDAGLSPRQAFREECSYAGD